MEFKRNTGEILLKAIDGFWDWYKPAKESCNKYDEAFRETNVGHLLNQTAFQWLYILTDRYEWKKLILDKRKPSPNENYPASCAILLIGNCIKHNEGKYKEDGSNPYIKGFKAFCDLKQPWMKGENVEVPLREFKVGNEINLSCVARAKDQLKKEIMNEINKTTNPVPASLPVGT